MFVNFGCKDLLYLKTHCSCDSCGKLPDNESHTTKIALPNVSSHNQNGPLPKQTIEIKNVNFLNKYDILCIISMILYVFNYMY